MKSFLELKKNGNDSVTITAGTDDLYCSTTKREVTESRVCCPQFLAQNSYWGVKVKAVCYIYVKIIVAQ
jgi:hypothetical protein